jgi:hypothetical protein
MNKTTNRDDEQAKDGREQNHNTEIRRSFSLLTESIYLIGKNSIDSNNNKHRLTLALALFAIGGLAIPGITSTGVGTIAQAQEGGGLTEEQTETQQELEETISMTRSTLAETASGDIVSRWSPVVWVEADATKAIFVDCQPGESIDLQQHMFSSEELQTVQQFVIGIDNAQSLLSIVTNTGDEAHAVAYGVLCEGVQTGTISHGNNFEFNVEGDTITTIINNVKNIINIRNNVTIIIPSGTGGNTTGPGGNTTDPGGNTTDPGTGGNTTDPGTGGGNTTDPGTGGNTTTPTDAPEETETPGTGGGANTTTPTEPLVIEEEEETPGETVSTTAPTTEPGAGAPSDGATTTDPVGDTTTTTPDDDTTTTTDDTTTDDDTTTTEGGGDTADNAEVTSGELTDDSDNEPEATNESEPEAV